MLTTLYSIHQIHTRSSSSKLYSKSKYKLTPWEMSKKFRDYIYLTPAQRRQNLCSSMPVIIHRIHSPSVLSSKWNKVPNMTPYRSGFPIDYISPVDPLNHDLNRQRQVHQSIVGCINWLATCTRPDIAPVLTFLASYINSPHPQQ